MKYLTQIKKLQVELSNFCNASCIGCRRVDHRTLTEKYELYNSPATFISLDIIQKILDSDHFKDIVEVEFCGTIDEPLAHPDFLEILQIIINFNPNLMIRIHTNASIRNATFFKKLAKLLIRFQKHEVRFSIDGLEESHKLYRGTVDYAKIMNHATVFIENGGWATWQMLQFPWNEHEVETCNQLAKDMGFKKFVFRQDRTHASTFKVDLIKLKRKLNTPAPPKVPPTEYEYPDDPIDVNCHYQNEGMVFLNWEGKLYPCCFMSNMNLTRLNNMSVQYNKAILGKYGKDFNNLHFKTVDEILSSPWFENDLVESWNNNYENRENEKLIVCVKSCGKKAPPISSHIKAEIING